MKWKAFISALFALSLFGATIPKASALKVSTSIIGYEVRISHKETSTLFDGAAGGALLAQVVGNPVLAAVLASQAAIILLTCEVGKHRGVKVMGTWLFPFMPIVVPK